eukprot:scaffold20.g7791.t1
MGVAQPVRRTCGSLQGLDEKAHNQAMAKVEALAYGRRQSAYNESTLRAAVLASPFPAGGVTVRVQFHVITFGGRSSVDDTTSPAVSANQLAQQIAVLNADFKSARLKFVAAPRPMLHVDESWTRACYDSLPDIYGRVVRSPATQLNVIVCDLASAGSILGVTPDMPNGANEASKSQVVALDFRTLPGGPYLRYSMGRTLTHELGHYFGLLHTFGSCDADPDGVGDTPAELDAASGCPAKRDSCPSQAGADPVWSFMDYSDDSCMMRFSLGQVARMQAVLLQYRPSLVAASATIPAPKPAAPSKLAQQAAKAKAKRGTSPTPASPAPTKPKSG